MESNVAVKLQEQERFEDLFILARYMYASGEYFISDSLYDSMVEIANQCGILTDYLNRNAEDDPVPMGLLKEFGIEAKEEGLGSGSMPEYVRRLTEEESFSIRPLFEYDSVWDFVQNTRGEDLVLSLKVDGVFCKSLIEDGEIKASISRGRHGGACYDYTHAVKQVTPPSFEDNNPYIIQSELFVEESWLNYLRGKYPNKDFVGPRFAGTSLARVKYSPEDYGGFKSLVHHLDGYGAKLSEKYEKSKSMGLEVVPYEVIRKEDIPLDKYEFVLWLRGKLDYYAESFLTIPSDGMVLSVDNTLRGYDVEQNYTTKNIALKLEYWNKKYYSGVVKSIVIEQRRVYASCRVTIEPMKLTDGTEARVINVFNPGLLIEAGLKEGSRVYYERTSNAINVLSRKGMINLEGDDL